MQNLDGIQCIISCYDWYNVESGHIPFTTSNGENKLPGCYKSVNQLSDSHRHIPLLSQLVLGTRTTISAPNEENSEAVAFLPLHMSVVEVSLLLTLREYYRLTLRTY